MSSSHLLERCDGFTVDQVFKIAMHSNLARIQVWESSSPSSKKYWLRILSSVKCLRITWQRAISGEAAFCISIVVETHRRTCRSVITDCFSNDVYRWPVALHVPESKVLLLFEKNCCARLNITLKPHHSVTIPHNTTKNVAEIHVDNFTAQIQHFVC